MCTVIETTRKVEAFVQLREAEQQFRFALEASGNVGTWSYDLESGKIRVDEHLAEAFGEGTWNSGETLRLQRFADLIHPDDRARVLQAFADAIASAGRYDIEYRLLLGQGSVVWVAARGRVFEDAVSGKRRCAGVAVDISLLKPALSDRDQAAHHAAVESERAAENGEVLEALLESAPVGLVFVDRAGKLILSNSTNKDIWGQHPTPESVGDYDEWKGWWGPGMARQGQLVRPEEWPLNRVLDGEAVAECVAEIEPFGQPGMRRINAIRAASVCRDGIEVVGVVGANMDITAQIAAENAFKESEERFRSITDVISQIVWSADASGTNDYINNRWAEFTGGLNVGSFGNNEQDLPALLSA